ncbi:hypothetical protein TELCIR_18431 [Teladorsagia circumcincta]|uniref:Anoctamin n=1 Tax=Teladorsagia circumcincta TaxID=45464 RepID=A0A2G9TQ00_TELCI|nr:hypothetical protein TELCIR_18431 [Teladorsagia circumcincta]
MNTVSTMILGSIYEWLVVKLTQWENHRTNSEYHNALVIKMFALQLVNNYTSLFYVAFIRPENNGFQVNGLFGLGDRYKDICLPGTCGSLLALQLISHMIIKPLPKFTKDIMFAALFPLAPLLALVIGIIDLRVDALRLLWLNRRPIPMMASVAFTSDFCSNFFSDVLRCDVKNRFLIVIVFQNMVFILKYVFQSIIPTVPASIRVAQRRKRYVVNYVTEKGDVPYRIKNRRRARNAKLAWVMSLAKGGMASKLVPKVGVEPTEQVLQPNC